MRRWLLLAVAPLLVGAAADPRIELLELQMNGDHAGALRRVEELLAEDATRSRSQGLEYLRGHLLEQLERAAESPAAFEAAAIDAPLISDYGSYRLARNRYESGQPEEAARLLASLLSGPPPQPVRSRVVAMLVRTLADGGACELLDARRGWSLSASQARHIQIPLADCALESGNREEARSILTGLLRQRRDDEPSLEAARRLAAHFGQELDPTVTVLVGLTLYNHRTFEQAVPFLESSAEESTASTPTLRNLDHADVLYALARSYYWQGEYLKAAERFSSAAAESRDSREKARALFQRGRSLALAGDWESAVSSYHQVAAADSQGSWAAAALLSALRLEWRQDREDTALALYRQIRDRRSWRPSIERAALFLASSDLVRGRTERAASWLDQARQARRRDTAEIRYWRGRLAELENRPDDALDQYLAVLTDNLYHPLAEAAGDRLESEALRPVVRERMASLGESNRIVDLRHLWHLTPASDPARREIANRLRDQWQQSDRTRSYLTMRTIEPSRWSLWGRRVRQAEDLLLTLGIVEAMSSSVRTAFPLDDNNLALTGSELLATAGLHKQSLYSAEVVGQRAPTGVPHSFLPETFRRLLYPRPFATIVAHQADRFGVDSDLLTAIIREESRFDPLAVSPASARGLTQFVLPTAQRLAAKLDLDYLHPSDLHDPSISITLGAVYLAELDRFFDNNQLQVITAYNAGEDLARLWQSYCFSREGAEYFTKVGYRQTRAYLEKVLTSRAHYREIYGRSPRLEPASISTSVGGRESKALSK